MKSAQTVKIPSLAWCPSSLTWQVEHCCEHLRTSQWAAEALASAVDSGSYVHSLCCTPDDVSGQPTVPLRCNTRVAEHPWNACALLERSPQSTVNMASHRVRDCRCSKASMLHYMLAVFIVCRRFSLSRSLTLIDRRHYDSNLYIDSACLYGREHCSCFDSHW